MCMNSGTGWSPGISKRRGRARKGVISGWPYWIKAEQSLGGGGIWGTKISCMVLRWLKIVDKTNERFEDNTWPNEWSVWSFGTFEIGWKWNTFSFLMTWRHPRRYIWKQGFIFPQNGLTCQKQLGSLVKIQYVLHWERFARLGGTSHKSQGKLLPTHEKPLPVDAAATAFRVFLPRCLAMVGVSSTKMWRRYVQLRGVFAWNWNTCCRCAFWQVLWWVMTS